MQAFGVSQDTTTNVAQRLHSASSMSSKTLRTVVGPGSVIQNSVGNLCGLAGAGGDLNCDLTGSLGCGVVFKLNTAGKETVLHRFGGSQADEGTPLGGLIRDNDGNLMRTIELQDFFNSFSPRLAPKTIRNMHGCMRTVFNQGKAWGLLTANPTQGSGCLARRPGNLLSCLQSRIFAF